MPAGGFSLVEAAKHISQIEQFDINMKSRLLRQAEFNILHRFDTEAVEERLYAKYESNLDIASLYTDYAKQIGMYGYEIKQELLKLEPKSAARLAEAILISIYNSQGRSDYLNGVIITLGEFTHINARFLGNTILLPLPVKPPVPYAPRKSGKASAFLRKHYRPWLTAGVLYQHHLSKIDPKLKEALDNEFKGQREYLRALIPTQEDETNDLLARHGFGDVEGPDRTRLASAIRSAMKLKP